MFEYKVVHEKDSRFIGKLDPDTLENTLNEHAAQGWRVVSALHASNAQKGPGAQIMVILERAQHDGD